MFKTQAFIAGFAEFASGHAVALLIQTGIAVAEREEAARPLGFQAGPTRQ
jgi:hypothetical protein